MAACPYQGTFKSYFPTYNAMSDRQLCGYFTRRAAVRRRSGVEAPRSIAYVYPSDLINCIGVAYPHEGLRALMTYRRSYREHAPAIGRFVSLWLHDDGVYQGPPAELPEPDQALSFNHSPRTLRASDEHACNTAAQDPYRKSGISAPPLPARAP